MADRDELKKQCIVGSIFSVKCNEGYLHQKRGFVIWSDLDPNKQTNIKANVSSKSIQVEIQESDVICKHHIAELSFPSSKSFHPKAPCINPFKIHTKNVHTEKLKILPYLAHLKGNPYSILPGQRVCKNCVSKCVELMKASIENILEEIQDPDWTDETANVKYQKVNQVCKILGLSEFKAVQLTHERKRKTAEGKIKEIITALVEEFEADGVSVSDVMSNDVVQKAKDCDMVFESVRQKFSKSNYKEQIQLLTLVPDTSTIWTLAYTSEYFKCPKYAVSKSRKIREEHGILAFPPPNKPRAHLSVEVITAVVNFYKQEDNVMQSPNVRDRKRIKLDNKTEYVQMAYLMHPLKDLYERFVKETVGMNYKIGFSSFANLRPIECATFNSKCIENVCVCMSHGNMEFMLGAIGEGREFRICLMESLVCDTETFDCMIGVCSTCSKDEKDDRYEAFKIILAEKLTNEDFADGVKYSNWKRDPETHRTKMIEVVQPVSEFIDELYSKMLKFIPHDKIPKTQSDAFQNHKRNHVETTAIVVGDFSENYINVIQNAIQQAYFTKSQVTIHPFVAYIKLQGEDHVISSAVISDHLDHDTITVFAFQKSFIKYLLEIFPHIKHIEYWSDGSAAQYKNYKNFSNIWHHEQDFGITANWNFFTTSHGKTGGDGVGASIKCSVRRESLRRTQSGFIDSAKKVFDYCESKGDAWKIKPLFVSSAEVTELALKFKLIERFELATKIPQTLKCHRIEISGTKLFAFTSTSSEVPFFELNSVKDISSEKEIDCPDITSQTLLNKTWNQLDYYEIQKGTWIAISQNGAWYVAKTQDNPNEEAGTIDVQKMEVPGSGKAFRVQPYTKNNKICIRTSDIICILNPQQAGSTARSSGQLKINPEDVQNVEQALLARSK